MIILQLYTLAYFLAAWFVATGSVRIMADRCRIERLDRLNFAGRNREARHVMKRLLAEALARELHHPNWR